MVWGTTLKQCEHCRCMKNIKDQETICKRCKNEIVEKAFATPFHGKVTE